MVYLFYAFVLLLVHFVGIIPLDFRSYYSADFVSLLQLCQHASVLQDTQTPFWRLKSKDFINMRMDIKGFNEDVHLKKRLSVSDNDPSNYAPRFLYQCGNVWPNI